MKIRTTLVLLVVVGTLLAACGGAAPRPLRRVIKFKVAVVMPSAINDMAFSQSMFRRSKSLQSRDGRRINFEIKYSENMFKVPDARGCHS